jgi:hypothetical protein
MTERAIGPSFARATLKLISVAGPVALILGASSPAGADRASSTIIESASTLPAPQGAPLPRGVAIAAAATPLVHRADCASPKLQYAVNGGGGPILSNVDVVQVNWGSNVSSSVIAQFEAWYPAIVSSSYVTWLTEYNADNQTIGAGTYHKNPKSSGGSWTITPTNTSTNLTQDDFGPEIVAQIQAGSLPAPLKDSAGNANTLYMIEIPKGITVSLQGNPTSDTQCNWCGFHWNYSDSTNGNIYYGIIANMEPGSACAPTMSSGTTKWHCGGTLDAKAGSEVVHGHELVEAITDPQSSTNNAWFDPNTNCGEIGDICNNITGSCGDTTCDGPSAGTVTVGGTVFHAQTEWSNKQQDCVMHGPGCSSNADCAGSPSTPICDTSSKVCRACTNADCTGATPACETTGSMAGQCVQCTSANKTACTGGTPVCNPATDTCRACQAQDCTTPTPVCEMSGAKMGACVQCDPSNKTACTGATPVCDGTTFTCVSCTMDSDCMPGHVCQSHTCVTSGCKSNADCTNPSMPVCDATTGQCTAGSGHDAGPGGGDSGAPRGDGGGGGMDAGGDFEAGDGVDGSLVQDTGGSAGGCSCIVSASRGGDLAGLLGAALSTVAVAARRRRARTGAR